MFPSPTPIYHITHVDNLQSIIADGGLKSCAELRASGSGYLDIAHQHIQDRRAQTAIPCGAGGMLHEYVPFYFAPRSPMLYAIYKGAVTGYTGGQQPIIHLVSTVQAIVQGRLAFVFTDGHATKAFTEFYDDLTNLSQVDWTIMAQKYWRDTLQDGDRKRRRQAEFLVHRFFPQTLFHEIGAYDQQTKQQVEQAFGNCLLQPNVTVKREWYY